MKVPFYIVGILLCALSFTTFRCIFNVNEKQRLRENFNAAMSDVRFYRTKDSLSAASVQQITLKHSELQKHYDDLVQDAASQNLKLRRIESASRTATVTEYKIETRWRDTVIYRPGRIDTIRCINYNDAFLRFHLCDEPSNQSTSVESIDHHRLASAHIEIIDTLVQFIHRVPKQFLCFRFGTKAIRQEVLTKNPHSSIVFTEYLKLQK